LNDLQINLLPSSSGQINFCLLFIPGYIIYAQQKQHKFRDFLNSSDEGSITGF